MGPSQLRNPPRIPGQVSVMTTRDVKRNSGVTTKLKMLEKGSPDLKKSSQEKRLEDMVKRR